MAVIVRLPPGARRLVAELQAEMKIALGASWALKAVECITLIEEDRLVAAAVCLSALAGELIAYPKVIGIVIELIDLIENSFTRGHKKMALPSLGTPPVCSTGNPRHKGICCSAVTQLGAAVAATGFQYTSCTGKTVCLKCGIGQSTSPKHPGRPIFIPRRVSCGPSGCPALSQA